MLPDAVRVLVVHVADGLLLFLGIVEAAKLHVVRLLVVAEVLSGIETTARVQRAHLRTGLAQRMKGHAASGAGSNDEHDVNLFRHISS